MADEEPKPMSVKERMKMFNKKKEFKVETSYDAIRRQRAEKLKAKKAREYRAKKKLEKVLELKNKN